jgi:hypothetical protein
MHHVIARLSDCLTNAVGVGVRRNAYYLIAGHPAYADVLQGMSVGEPNQAVEDTTQ